MKCKILLSAFLKNDFSNLRMNFVNQFTRFLLFDRVKIGAVAENGMIAINEINYDKQINNINLSFLSQTSPIAGSKSSVTPLPICIRTSSDLSFRWTFDNCPRQNLSLPAGSTNPSIVTFLK